MAHAIWSGSINFGLVTIPVKLFTAVREGQDIHFHFLHDADQGRIKNERVCAECEKKIAWDHVIRGYEYEKGQYVVVTEEDFKKANVEATQSVDIVEFVAEGEIDPMLFDKPYYLEPEKKGRHAYALLREALRTAGKVGIARVVLRSREHIAAVRPHGEALVLELMHWADEVVDPADLELPAEGKEKMPGPEMKAAQMLIDAMTRKFDKKDFHDTYKEQLLALIESRARGEPLPKTPGKGHKPSVLNLMDVLEKSLAATRGKKGRPENDAKADDDATPAAKGRSPAKARPRSHAHRSKRSAA